MAGFALVITCTAGTDMSYTAWQRIMETQTSWLREHHWLLYLNAPMECNGASMLIEHYHVCRVVMSIANKLRIDGLEH